MTSVSQCPKCGADTRLSDRPGFCPGCALLSIGLDDFLLGGDDAEALPGELLPGAMVGRYEITDKLGTGGSGDVYAAQQEGEVGLPVAIKVLRSAALSDRVVARFEAERDAMLRMDHPGIARVTDAGFLDDGRPFVAMEHIAGEPLNEYLENHPLTLKQRLAIFIQICAAVQHAHLKGVMHRDLKPTNILVSGNDSKAVPKLIDFGIARTLDRPEELDALFTQQAEILGTPAYMSPEQTLGGNADIDVRSDVYALGIILYELLTGAPPIDPDALRYMSIDAACQAIRETEAARPSSLATGIDTDLDAVTLKALAKEPERRYQSANALAEDLERFLKSEPVTAKPPTASYKLGKFVRRNRSGVLAGAAILASIIIGAIISLYQAGEARSARDAEKAAADLATGRLDDSEDLIQFMVTDLYQQLRPIGKLETLSDTAEKVETFYQKLGQENRSTDSLKRQGTAYLYLGRVRSAQGKPDQAVADFERGIEVLNMALEKSPDDEKLVDTLSNLWESLGSHHIRQLDTEAANLALEKASQLTAQQLAREPDNSKWRNIYTGQNVNRAALLADQRRWQDSLDLLEKARALTDDTTKIEVQMLIEQNACRALIGLGRLDEAEIAGKAAIALHKTRLDEAPDDTAQLMKKADLLTNLSVIQFRRKDIPAVIASNLETSAIQEKLLAVEPQNVYWRTRLADTYKRLALAYNSSEQEEPQREAAGKVVELLEPLAFAEEANDSLKAKYRQAINYLERSAVGQASLQQSFDRRIKAYPIYSDKTGTALEIGRTSANLSIALAASDQTEKAEDYRNLAIWILEKHPQTKAQLEEANWPLAKLNISTPPDKARLTEAITSNRLKVPESWRKEL